MYIYIYIYIYIYEYIYTYIYIYIYNQVVRGDGTGPSSGTQSEKGWEPLVYMNLELLERGDLPIVLFLILPRVYIINCQLQLNRSTP